MDAHNHTAHEMALGHSDMNLECDGTRLGSAKKGSWKGHVLPGSVFVIWGSWWCLNTICYHLWRSARRPYRGRAWFPLPRAALLEPVLKVLVPVVAVSAELWLDHAPREYRYLYCPPGTKYAGRFAMSHMNNWQHTSSYPAFVLSGLVDIVARYVPLPPGTCQAVLGFAFGVMAFLMGTHEKHEPQDKAVHWLLFVAMLLCTVLVFLELAARRNVLAGLGKAAAVVLQGAWLIQIAAIEFEDRPQWGTDYAGGAMFAPVAFCLIAVLVLACTLAAYLALAALHQRGLLRRPPMLPPAEAEELEEEQQQQLPLRGMPRHPHSLHHYDSANHSDDGEGEGEGLLEGPYAKRGAAPAAVSLQMAAKEAAAAVDRV